MMNRSHNADDRQLAVDSQQQVLLRLFVVYSLLIREIYCVILITVLYSLTVLNAASVEDLS